MVHVDCSSHRFVLREASRADNQALLELSRACPMDGDISIAIEREPDFFALAEMRGSSRIVVAEDGGRIVACASSSRRKAWIQGRPGTMGYVGDMKVAPGYRRQGLSQLLLNELARIEAEFEPAPYVGLTANGNQAADKVVLRFGKNRKLRQLTSFCSWQLLCLWPQRVGGRFEIRRATRADTSELISLLDRYHQRFDFAPVFGDGGLKQIMDRSPGMEIESYLLAIAQDRVVAALAVWDEGNVKNTRVRSLTAPLRLISGGFRLMNRLVPMPPFPQENQLLRFSYLRHPAFREGHRQALGALVRHAVSQARRKNLHFVMMTLNQNDPAQQVLRGIPRTAFRYNMMAGTNSDDYQDQLARLDGGPFYDDAALA